jgi:endonuclease/exonuclease/phosphatase family metal-dependent hydrolase
MVYLFVAIILAGYYAYEKEIFPIKDKVTIVSYNIHSGLDKDMAPSLDNIIKFLSLSKADIICLQEVNESAKVGFQVSSLQQKLGMYLHFGANVIKTGMNYGLVNYSKYPIIDQNHTFLSSSREQRGMLHSVVNVNGKDLNVINVHLGLDKEERRKQMNEIIKYVSKLEKPYVLVGDFNQSYLDVDKNYFKDVAKELKQDHILTHITTLNRIDYILTSDDVEIVSYDVLFENMSDHYPIIVKIKI